VPALFLTTPAAAASLRRYVEGGGTLLVSCFSGIVDDNDRVYPGPYPGALRDVLGVTVEEWLPLRAGEEVSLSWEDEEAGLTWGNGGEAVAGRAAAWTEAVRLTGAKPVLRYADGPAAGGPAVTRFELGQGRAWYISAQTDAATTAALLAAACESAGVRAPGIATDGVTAGDPTAGSVTAGGSTTDGVSVGGRTADGRTAGGFSADGRTAGGFSAGGGTAGGFSAGGVGPGGWPRELEVTRRVGGGRRFTTLINHGEVDAAVQLGGRVVTVPSGEVLVIEGDAG
jgi:hypothetical protein